MLLQDIYQNLSPELQRIIGTVEWPDYHTLLDIADSIDGGTAIGVSDGSVVRTLSDGATHAWIIQANNRSEISGRGPVGGTAEAKTSHRAARLFQVAVGAESICSATTKR